MSPVQIAEHNHCEVCGRVVKGGQRWCGDECKEKHDAAMREKKKWMWIWVAAIAATLLLFNLIRAGVL